MSQLHAVERLEAPGRMHERRVVRVLVADDHPAMRGALARLVRVQSGVLDVIRERAGGAVRLSARERELLELAAQGLTTAEVADRLFLSPNTVKTYWQRLFEKLGASDRVSAVAEAIRRGLVQ